MNENSPTPKKKSWRRLRDAYQPKNFKDSPVQAMIQSGTLDRLKELMPNIDLEEQASSGRKSPLDLLKQQKSLIHFGNLPSIDEHNNDSVNEAGSNHSNEELLSKRFRQEDHELLLL